MAIPRSQLVDPTTSLYYHLVSRCVRRSWLCGTDPLTHQDYSHRKEWLIERMRHLATSFAIDIEAWSIMDNHFHLVAYFDPTACLRWTDDEVARRWVNAFPPKSEGKVDEDLKHQHQELLLEDPVLLEDRRKKLGCLSTFMKHLKQPIARRANQEDGCQGHFFESRFYSGALLTEEAVLAAMAYVDLNPIRAKIAQSLEQCRNTSIIVRLKHLENSLEKLHEIIGPLVSGLKEQSRRLRITLGGYINALTDVIQAEHGLKQDHRTHKQARWLAQVRSIHKRQRAYGTSAALSQWIEGRGLKRAGHSLPE